MSVQRVQTRNKSSCQNSMLAFFGCGVMLYSGAAFVHLSCFFAFGRHRISGGSAHKQTQLVTTTLCWPLCVSVCVCVCVCPYVRACPVVARRKIANSASIWKWPKNAMEWAHARVPSARRALAHPCSNHRRCFRVGRNSAPLSPLMHTSSGAADEPSGAAAHSRLLTPTLYLCVFVH